MDIKTFASGLDADQKRLFCKELGTSVAYLSQLQNGFRNASPRLARRMVDASAVLFPDDPDQWLTLNGIRPDIWDSAAA